MTLRTFLLTLVVAMCLVFGLVTSAVCFYFGFGSSAPLAACQA